MTTSPDETETRDQSADLAVSVAAMATAVRESQAAEARERRWGRRRAFLWRALIILVLVGAAVSAALEDAPVTGDHIARYTVDGVIADDPERDALLKKIAENDSVKALIVRINSPGGTTTGGEALYESLRAVAAEKPVVAVMGEVAASAGYITALAADHVIARGNTITASVGVIFTAPNFHKLLDNVGVSVVELKSGARKAEPSPYKPVDPSTLRVERELIDDTFDWFLTLVRERREAPASTIATIRDGRILTGRMALKAGLVDQIGGQEEAITWLQEEKGVASGLSVVDRAIDEPEPSFLAGLLRDLIGDGGALASTQVGQRLEQLFSGPALLSVLR